MCKEIKKENIVTMYDERVAELEHLLAAANDEIIRHEQMKNSAQKRYDDDTNILASMLRYVIEGSLEKEQVDAAIAAQSYEVSKVLSVLEFHDAVPEHMLCREYYVSITVPVTVCVTVEAFDEDTAEEMARDYVESNGIEYYEMEYNTYYDAEYSVTEA
jgi:hypothetical protein